MKNLLLIPNPLLMPAVPNGKQVLFKREMAIVFVLALVISALFPLSVNADCLSTNGISIKEAAAFDVGKVASTISIQDDIYLKVDTEAFSITVKKVRIYTDNTKTTLVDIYEGCGFPVCTYNLVTEGLANGSYFVEVETYSGTFFSGWIDYN